MATIRVSGQQIPDRVLPAEPAEVPGKLMSSKEERTSGPESPKEEISSIKDDNITSPSVPVNVTASALPTESTIRLGFLEGSADVNSHHSSSYPQMHAVYYAGYENSQAMWDEYSQILYSEGMELGTHGNHPLIFHTSYGYSPQMPFGPYSPVNTLPLVRRENHLYSRDPPHNGPYYHQPGPNTIAYLNLPSPSSPANSVSSVGPGPSLLSNGQYFHDPWQALDGFSPGGVWSDWLKSSDSLRPLTPLSPAVSTHPFGHGFSSFSSTTESRRQRPYNRKIAVSAVNSSLCNCTEPIDFLNEQNRGPRVVKPEVSGVDFGSYNKFDFKTDYDDARFFVIKSYSEDNVHKSIKYGVWASTPNGNRKLDVAYSESKVKGTECPVFLLFSVNASAHFCGVAEMVGPVDFEKSVDYWQQDKWTGHFPVKWHVIKDVPNSLFRHIILENNDNKPVTNSRDTQEVNLEQGLEMLSIFKMHESYVSILDDFNFYEERERAMEQRKASQRKQHEQVPPPAVPLGQLQKTFAQAVRLDEKDNKKEEAAAVTAIEVAGGATREFPQ